jgi:hypothetical protein
MATNPEDAHESSPTPEAVEAADAAEAIEESIVEENADATVAEPPAPAPEEPVMASVSPNPRIVIGRGRRLFKIPSKDSGFYGSGTNLELGDDNSARETTPGFQQDKWERGTLMPR